MNKKLISVIFFIIIGVAVIYTGYVLFSSSVYNYYESWKIGRAYHKFETEFTNYLKNDTYGGATPEETYKLFVKTLQSGDIESASKYFYRWEDKEKEKQIFQRMKDDGSLEKYITDMPEWGKLKEERRTENDIAYSWTAFYEQESGYDPLTQKEVIFPAGEAKREIDFYLNKQANIWKIYSL